MKNSTQFYSFGAQRRGRPRGHVFSFLITVLSLLACTQAYSQVMVHLKMNKANYILNEPVTATVTITNHAGRELVLRGDGSSSWLSFQLSANARVIPSARRMNYRPVVVPAGQTVARQVSLSSSFSLGRMGNYTLLAMVNMPGEGRNAYSSNRVHFTIANGRTAWVQRAGIPDAPGEIREYKLLTFTGNRAMELFAQVNSANTGVNIRTIPLGKIDRKSVV